MSVEIEFCDTVSTKEEIVKKSEQLKEWIGKAQEEPWKEMGKYNSDIMMYDQPMSEGKTFFKSTTIFKCNAKKVYEFIKTISEEDQKKYE